MQAGALSAMGSGPSAESSTSGASEGSTSGSGSAVPGPAHFAGSIGSISAPQTSSSGAMVTFPERSSTETDTQ